MLEGTSAGPGATGVADLATARVGSSSPLPPLLAPVLLPCESSGTAAADARRCAGNAAAAAGAGPEERAPDGVPTALPEGACPRPKSFPKPVENMPEMPVDTCAAAAGVGSAEGSSPAPAGGRALPEAAAAAGVDGSMAGDAVTVAGDLAVPARGLSAACARITAARRRASTSGRTGDAPHE